MTLHKLRYNNEDQLLIGRMTVKELAEKYGTPLIIYDENYIREQMQTYLQAIKKNYPGESQILYAGKAFLAMSLCKIIEQEGLGLDVVSGGELFLAREAGFPAEKIYFHGNNKLPSEIELALESGINCFVIDNLIELREIERQLQKDDRPVQALLRVAPGIEAHTHHYIQTGQLDSKFGTSLAEGKAMKLIKEIQISKKVELRGIHAHIGSQIFSAVAYEQLVEIIFSFIFEIREKLGITIKELDLGGGIGIAYTGEEKLIEPADLIKRIAVKIQKEAAKIKYPLPKLVIEPGRSIIGPAGTTIYTVGSIKDTAGNKKYIAINGGMTDNPRPALYNAKYIALPAQKKRTENLEEVTIAGKCCESGDILIEKIELPELKTGDLIVVPATGAYTFAMASNYNGIPRPAVVLVDEDKAKLIIRRETYQDLISNHIIPESLSEEGE